MFASQVITKQQLLGTLVKEFSPLKQKREAMHSFLEAFGNEVWNLSF